MATDESENSPALPQGVESSSWVIDSQDAGKRLDVFLNERFPDQSRSQLQRQIVGGAVSVDGYNPRPSFKLKVGHVVTATLSDLPTSDLIGEDIPLRVLYEDEAMIAIDKAAGMVVHPAKGHWQGTLTAALAFHFNRLSSLGGPHRPGIVHRLDRDTSGVILIAKTDTSHRALTEQFEQRSVEKHYCAIVAPAPDRDRDLIEQPIGPHPYQREKMAIRAGHVQSRPASTFFTVIERFPGFAVLDVQPRTGRTHQIRVHLASIRCPILCDRLYSGRAAIDATALGASATSEPVLSRQALHAASIEFDHPIDGRRMRIEAELATDIQRVIELLRSRT